MAVAAVVLVVVIIVVATSVVLASRGGDKAAVVSTSSTAAQPSTTTSVASTSTTAAPETSSTTSSTAPAVAGPAGDSSGEWAEAEVPSLSGEPLAVALSQDALVYQVETSGRYRLVAHLFASGEDLDLPVGKGDVGGVGLDGDTAVWWEGAYDEKTSSYTDQHVYAYRLPDGPKVDIVKGQTNVGYPHVAGSWVTWVQGSPWEENPDEYWRMPIFGCLLDSHGRPIDQPTSLVPSVVAAIEGDAGWSYSLSDAYLAWEQSAEAEGLKTGTYVLDLGTLQTQLIGLDAWRPSLAGDKLVYWENGLQLIDLSTGKHSAVDPRGDFGTAGPTFAAYFRAVQGADGGYEIVARGYTGSYEQVLATQSDAPWLSTAIAVSATRVAYVAGGSLHLFEWKAE